MTTGILQKLAVMLGGDLPPEDPADHHIARQAYADYLRAQLIGYAPDKGDALLALLTEEDGRNTAPFATLMGVETRLVSLMSDEQVARNYWMVRDRLNRVGSPAAIREHKGWAPETLARDPAAPDRSSLDDARAAKAAALAWVGETAMALAEREESLAAAGTGPSNAMRVATEEARAAHRQAVIAATAATARVADLETFGADADVDGAPPLDEGRLARDAVDAESETRHAQAVAIAAEEAETALAPAPEGRDARRLDPDDVDDPLADVPIVTEEDDADGSREARS